jgi:hypothetical protein
MHYVLHKGKPLFADQRTMKQLGLQQEQQVDEAMLWLIIECNYAWLVTDLELQKAAAE